MTRLTKRGHGWYLAALSSALRFLKLAKTVSSPMKSAIASGPITTLVANFIVLSISSLDIMSSYKANAASLIYGIRMRLVMKPGTSFAYVLYFFIDLATANVVARVSSLVSRDAATYTSFIVRAGLEKCMPMTWCALSGTQPPNFDIEILLVFDAKIAWSGTV